MRYYQIKISPSSVSKVSFTPVVYSSINRNGTDNGAALSVDIDVFQTWYNQPAQNGFITIRGVDFSQLNQSANFNFAKIQVYVGMSKGLPYANPKQAGLIIDGTILQCFGNWLGNDVSLNLVIAPANYDPNQNVNLSFNWQKGATLTDAVKATLNNAYKDVPINGQFSKNLVYPQNAAGQYSDLLSFSNAINKLSRQVIKDPTYFGAQISSTSSGFLLFDGTSTSVKTNNIDFTDMVGNLTWKDFATINAKLIMRYDLNVGDYIVFPKGSPVLNVVNNGSQFRNNISFQGKFIITSVRHVGSSRQPNGYSWCTIVDAVIPGTPLV